MSAPVGVRKLVLTAHVATAVGWFGALLAYLVLDLVATTGGDVQRVRAAYVGMDLTVSYVIVPLALGSVAIGILNALITPWGLLRHYWVVVKLVLTLAATAVLLIERRTVRLLAEDATSGADPRAQLGTLVHSIGGLVVLLLVLVLSVYKPSGVTRYGWRKQQRMKDERALRRTS